MRLAIMQPYFVPYLGYFSLIKNTDKFIFFDTPQFIRHGWVERNRILKPIEGVQYISIPLYKKPQNTSIKDMVVRNSEDWKEKLVSQLQHYRKIAPFYKNVMNLLDKILFFDSDSIVDWDVRFISIICDYLGIDFNFEIFSKMNLPIEPVFTADEWALNICKALGNIDEYWNPPGGKVFFDPSKYAVSNIALKFQKVTLTPYSQGRDLFEEGLSIIDVLMFNEIGVINKMLERYEFV